MKTSTLRKVNAGLLGYCFLTLGNRCWDGGNCRRASRYFRKATRIMPSCEVSSLGLFHTLWEDGQCRQAVREMLRFTDKHRSAEYDAIFREILRLADELKKPNPTPSRRIDFSRN